MSTGDESMLAESDVSNTLLGNEVGQQSFDSSDPLIIDVDSKDLNIVQSLKRDKKLLTDMVERLNNENHQLVKHLKKRSTQHVFEADVCHLDPRIDGIIRNYEEKMERAQVDGTGGQVYDRLRELEEEKEMLAAMLEKLSQENERLAAHLLAPGVPESHGMLDVSKDIEQSSLVSGQTTEIENLVSSESVDIWAPLSEVEKLRADNKSLSLKIDILESALKKSNIIFDFDESLSWPIKAQSDLEKLASKDRPLGDAYSENPKSSAGVGGRDKLIAVDKDFELTRLDVRYQLDFLMHEREQIKAELSVVLDENELTSNVSASVSDLVSAIRQLKAMRQLGYFDSIERRHEECQTNEVVSVCAENVALEPYNDQVLVNCDPTVSSLIERVNVLTDEKNELGSKVSELVDEQKRYQDEGIAFVEEKIKLERRITTFVDENIKFENLVVERNELAAKVEKLIDVNKYFESERISSIKKTNSLEYDNARLLESEKQLASDKRQLEEVKLLNLELVKVKLNLECQIELMTSEWKTRKSCTPEKVNTICDDECGVFYERESSQDVRELSQDVYISQVVNNNSVFKTLSLIDQGMQIVEDISANSHSSPLDLTLDRIVETNEKLSLTVSDNSLLQSPIKSLMKTQESPLMDENQADTSFELCYVKNLEKEDSVSVEKETDNLGDLISIPISTQQRLNIITAVDNVDDFAAHRYEDNLMRDVRIRCRELENLWNKKELSKTDLEKVWAELMELFLLTNKSWEESNRKLIIVQMELAEKVLYLDNLNAEKVSTIEEHNKNMNELSLSFAQRLKELDTLMDEKNIKIIELTKAFDKLDSERNSTIDQLNRVISNLESQCLVLEATDIENQSSQLASAQDEITSLLKLQKTLECRVLKAEEEKNTVELELKDRIRRIELDMNTCITQSTENEAVFKTLVDDVNEKSELVRLVVETDESKQVEITSVDESKIGDLQNYIQELLLKISLTEGERNEAIAAMNRIMRELDSKTKEMIEPYRAELDVILGKLTDVKSELMETRKIMDITLQQLENQTVLYSEAQLERKSLQTLLGDNRDLCTELTRENVVLKGQLSAAHTRYAEAEFEIESTHIQLTDISSLCVDYKLELETTKHELSVMMNGYTESEQDRSTLQHKLSDVDTHCAEIDSEKERTLRKIGNVVLQLQGEIESLYRSQTSHRSEFEEMKVKHSQAVEQLGHVLIESTRLREALDMKTHRISELETNLLKYQFPAANLYELVSKRDDTEEERMLERKRVSVLEKRLTECEEERDVAIMQVEAVTKDSKEKMDAERVCAQALLEQTQKDLYEQMEVERRNANDHLEQVLGEIKNEFEDSKLSASIEGNVSKVSSSGAGNEDGLVSNEIYALERIRTGTRNLSELDKLPEDLTDPSAIVMEGMTSERGELLADLGSSVDPEEFDDMVKDDSRVEPNVSSVVNQASVPGRNKMELLGVDEIWLLHKDPIDEKNEQFKLEQLLVSKLQTENQVWKCYVH